MRWSLYRHFLMFQCQIFTIVPQFVAASRNVVVTHVLGRPCSNWPHQVKSTTTQLLREHFPSSKSWSALRWKPKEEEIQESVRNLKRVEQALKLSPQIADCTQPTNANTNPSKSRNTNTEETVQDSPGHLRGPMGAWGGLVGPLRISTEHLRGSLSPKEGLLGS